MTQKYFLVRSKVYAFLLRCQWPWECVSSFCAGLYSPLKSDTPDSKQRVAVIKPLLLAIWARLDYNADKFGV